MALVNRQNSLFAAEDWKVAYRAYSEVNFQAYDFDTIRSALVEYVRTNFPENFNDYIESSEFIAIIELLAYLSQSLSFRMDLNSRENFLETAERRDSVFKLARMLGYNPKRNIPASGLMKIVSVKTNEPIQDSLGNELNNVNIYWDDANNPDSYEQFITVLNAAMNTNNRFTSPTKSGSVNKIPTDLYEIKTPNTAPVSYGFDIPINGVNRTFQVVNPDFEDGGVFSELHPDPINNFNLIYRNDGTGISSSNTGFFIMFKQGNLAYQDYNYTTAVENRTQEVNIANINETDVYLQEIDSSGAVLNKWSKIPNTVGQTLNYNDLAFGTRTLYAVENLNSSGIKLRFPDGNFGNIPYGLFRLYYRTSDPESFTMQPQDARNIKVAVPYLNTAGTEFTLTLTFSLQTSVNNSLPPESKAAIKDRAPQVYYTQNRMVSAQDYNIFPYSQTTNITKLKAINKTHAGHSRFIDINDPTGTYQNVDVYTNDGSLYSEFVNGTDSITISENNTTTESISFDLPVVLKNINLNNFVYEQFRRSWKDYFINKFSLASKNATWKSLPVVTGTSSTGYFTETTSSPGNISVLDNSVSGYNMFTENNFIKFVNPTDESSYSWTRITSVDNNGLLSSGLSTSTGPFTIGDRIQDGWKADEYISTMRKIFTSAEETAIKTEMDNKRTFGLGYDPEADSWYIITNSNLNKTASWSPNFAGDTSGTGKDSSWLLLFNYSAIDTTSYKFIISLRGQRYVVQSKNDLKFYNISNIKVADSLNQASRDVISFGTLNFKPGGSEIFTWSDTDSDGIGDAWKSDETFESYNSVGFETGLPLRTRSTKWHDVETNFITNLGIYREGDFASNLFVSTTTIGINTNFETGDPLAGRSYLTIANNSGVINYWPSSIDLAFTNSTFGYNIIDSTTGNVIYRDYNSGTGFFEIYQANTSGTTKSFGFDGASYNASADGRIVVSDIDASAETGNLTITGLVNNNYTYVLDASGVAAQDKLEVRYKSNKEQIDQDIEWNIVSPVKYNDGYTDNRKAIVAPIDTDGDLVPDRPLQFREFVGEDDIIFFEYYTDFDGYTYDRPVTGNIADFRYENTLVIDYSDGGNVSPGSVNNPQSLDDIDLMVVKNISVLNSNPQAGSANGLVVYDFTNESIYQYQQNSTNFNKLTLIETEDFFVRNGRAAGQNTSLISDDEIIFKWKHVAPKDVRIDPSISNVVEMLVLTTSYYEEIKKYKNVPGTEFPLPPTSSELANEFANLDEFKSASDTLVYRSAQFKLLFGSDAAAENQAKFRIVKLGGATISDNEIKSRVIGAINTFFDVSNWEFGEIFYFTELSSYIHQRLGSNIGSIVILPKNSSGSFGDLFQIKADPNELFLSTARVSDIEIIEKISSQTLRADR